MNINKGYILETMVNLLNTPSPTGDTDQAIDLVEGYFKALGVSTKRTIKNALIGTIQGKNDDQHKVLSAHVDTLGAMVKEIKPNGRIKLSQLGSFPWTSIEGEYCVISTQAQGQYTGTILFDKASSHVHGSKVGDTKRSVDNIEVRIDEKVHNKEDVENLGISVGDFIYFETRTLVTKRGFIKSRHLDDKACVACLLGIAEYLVQNEITPLHTTHFFISNYEEVGHGSAASIPEKTTEFVAVDMAAPGDGQTSDEFSVTICAKDSSGPYDFDLRKRLTKLASDHALNYKIDIYPFYGSDASAALRAGHAIKHGLIGPGVDASHSYERLHIDSVLATVNLGILYLTK